MPELVTKDMQKAEVLNAFFSLVFTVKTGFQESQVPVTSGKVQSKEDLPLVEEDQVREQLNKMDIHKAMGPSGIHSWVLRS